MLLDQDAVIEADLDDGILEVHEGTLDLNGRPPALVVHLHGIRP